MKKAKQMKMRRELANLLVDDPYERNTIVELMEYLPYLLNGRKYSDLRMESAKEMFAEIGFDPESETSLLEFLRQRKIALPGGEK